MFPLYQLWSTFFYKWMLNFVKYFLCINWDDHVIFILPFVNVMHYIGWFVNTEPSLHLWNKSHLIVVYDPFNILLDSNCQYLFICFLRGFDQHFKKLFHLKKIPLMSFCLTFFISLQLGDAVTYLGLEVVFFCGSIPMQSVCAQCLC